MNDRYDMDVIKEFVEQFNKEYEFLYNAHCNGKSVCGENEAMYYADLWMNHHANQKFMVDLIEYRGDYFTSDREMMAFGFALEEFGF